MNCVIFCVQYLDWICTVIVDCVISVIIGSLADVPFHKIASGLWGGALRDDTICGRSWVSWTIWSDLVASWAAERTQLKVENGYHKCWWSLACCLPFLWRNSSAQNVVDVFDHRFLSHQEQGLWHHCFHLNRKNGWFIVYYTRSSILKYWPCYDTPYSVFENKFCGGRSLLDPRACRCCWEATQAVEKRFQRTLFRV